MSGRRFVDQYTVDCSPEVVAFQPTSLLHGDTQDPQRIAFFDPGPVLLQTDGRRTWGRRNFYFAALETHADGNHTRNGRDALLHVGEKGEERSNGFVSVARVPARWKVAVEQAVNGRINAHDVLRVDRIHPQQADHAAHRQTRAGQQHEGQSDLAHDQGPAEPCTPPILRAGGGAQL